jgi:hypothetical protein
LNPCLDNISQRTQCLSIDQTVITGIRLCQAGKFIAVLPIELPRIHNNPAYGCAVAADKLGGRMYDDIRAVFDRLIKIGGGKGVVDKQGDPIFMGNTGYFFYINDIDPGIADGFYIQCFSFRSDGLAEIFRVIGVHKDGFYPQLGQSEGKQVVCTAIQGGGRDNLIPRAGDI